MLNSASGNSSSISARSTGRSAWRVCRSSGRGCTVSPCAPAASAMRPIPSTLGHGRSRRLRSMAIALRLTDSLGGHGESRQQRCGCHPYSRFGGNWQGVWIVPTQRRRNTKEKSHGVAHVRPGRPAGRDRPSRPLRLRPGRTGFSGRCREFLRACSRRPMRCIPPIDVLVRVIDQDGSDSAGASQQTLDEGKAHAGEHVRRCALVGNARAIPEIRRFFASSVEVRQFRRQRARPRGNGSAASRSTATDQRTTVSRSAARVTAV